MFIDVDKLNNDVDKLNNGSFCIMYFVLHNKSH